DRPVLRGDGRTRRSRPCRRGDGTARRRVRAPGPLMNLSPAAVRFLSIAGLIAFWALLAALHGNPRVLPGPADLLPRLWAEIASGELPFHVGATLGRVAAAFVVAMAIGVALGL